MQIDFQFVGDKLTVVDTLRRQTVTPYFPSNISKYCVIYPYSLDKYFTAHFVEQSDLNNLLFF